MTFTALKKLIISFMTEKDKIDKLKQELAQARDKHGSTKSSARARPSNAMGLAMRIISDLIAAICVGTAMGWGLDYLTGWAPLFLVIFFFLGLAAGLFNVMKTAKEMNQGEAPQNDETSSN
jgi:ATP synthase protein I